MFQLYEWIAPNLYRVPSATHILKINFVAKKMLHTFQLNLWMYEFSVCPPFFPSPSCWKFRNTTYHVKYGFSYEYLKLVFSLGLNDLYVLNLLEFIFLSIWQQYETIMVHNQLIYREGDICVAEGTKNR